MWKLISITLLFVITAFGPVAFAQDSEDTSDDTASEYDSGQAMQDLENANQDSQEAVDAVSDEDAKVESGETFDTPHDSDGD